MLVTSILSFFPKCFLPFPSQISVFQTQIFCRLPLLWIWTGPRLCCFVKSYVFTKGLNFGLPNSKHLQMTKNVIERLKFVLGMIENIVGKTLFPTLSPFPAMFLKGFLYRFVTTQPWIRKWAPLKTLWDNEKMLEASIFSFPLNIFDPLKDKSFKSYFKWFQFGLV